LKWKFKNLKEVVAVVWCIIGWIVAAFLLGGLLGVLVCPRREGRRERGELDRKELLQKVEELRAGINEKVDDLLKWLRGS